MRENVSRRRVLKLSAAVLGSGSVTDARRLLAQRSDAIIGWITKGKKKTIAEKRATVESFTYSGLSLCNDGDVFNCRTCSGVEFFLLVPSHSSEPNLGETYRFSLTGEDNRCGNFQVQLLEADSCGNSTDTTTTETTTTDTPTSTTDTTTSTTDTTETTTSTTETTSETETTTTETTTDTPTSETETTTTDTPTSTTDTPTSTTETTTSTTETTTDDD